MGIETILLEVSWWWQVMKDMENGANALSQQDTTAGGYFWEQWSCTSITEPTSVPLLCSSMPVWTHRYFQKGRERTISRWHASSRVSCGFGTMQFWLIIQMHDSIGLEVWLRDISHKESHPWMCWSLGSIQLLIYYVQKYWSEEHGFVILSLRFHSWIPSCLKLLCAILDISGEEAVVGQVLMPFQVPIGFYWLIIIIDEWLMTMTGRNGLRGLAGNHRDDKEMEASPAGVLVFIIWNVTWLSLCACLLLGLI
jgi:hypothetical protein